MYNAIEAMHGKRPLMTPDLMSNSPFHFNTDKENWKENLAVHQKSLGALFQAPIHVNPTGSLLQVADT